MEVQVLQGDAFRWLPSQKFGESTAIVTGLPDESELDPEQLKTGYEVFLSNAAACIFKAVAPPSYVIFMQTDRKKDGHWVDKASILTSEARKNGFRTVFHKIILTRLPESVNFFRPTYTHFLCFSQTGRSGRATADVVFGGKALYKNGMGADAVAKALDFLRGKGIRSIVDPFCGQGTVLVVAKKLFLSDFDNIIGLDIDPEQVQQTKKHLRNCPGKKGQTKFS